MKSKLLCMLVGMLTASLVLGAVTVYRATRIDDMPADTAPVDQVIQGVIVSADRETEITEEHKSKIEREVVVIREKALTRVLAYGPDELVSVALGRIERFRRAVGADSTARSTGVEDAD